jgi:hypothetical protein
VEEAARQVAGDDGLMQRDEDRMARARGRVVALVEHRTPGLEQRRVAVGDLVAEVVGDAAEGVDALKVGADAFGKKEGGDVEVLVVRGGEMAWHQARASSRWAIVGGQVLGGRAGEGVWGERFQRRCSGIGRSLHGAPAGQLPGGKTAVLMSGGCMAPSGRRAAAVHHAREDCGHVVEFGACR